MCFSKGHSCPTSLRNGTDDIFTAQDQNKFDKIKHSLLLATMHLAGFHKNSISFIKHYLTNRSVSIKHVKSDYLNIENGFTQESVLRSLFFILYTFQFYSFLF